ncbi:hypothetical protein ACV1DN_20845 [Aeromonas allosaccharophila]
MDFSATTEIELDEALEKLKVQVPPRGKGRTTDHCERWQIHALLVGLKKGGYLRFPVTLKKRERPDFQLISGAVSLGIEAIEAINPDYARAQTLSEAKDEHSVIDPSLFKWGNVGRSLKELRDIVALDKLTGTGWHGDSVEREFARSILDCVEQKHKLLLNGFERFDANCLLIYHNNSTPVLDFDKGTAFAEELLKSYWSTDGFDVVFVLKYRAVIVLTKGLSAIIEIES